MDAKIVKLGSVYFDGKPVEAGDECNNAALSIGDTIPGKEIQWVDDRGYLVADRCVCTCISQRQLLKQGFLYGIPILIDSKPYLCRCLKVGDKAGRPNEWDDLLLKYGASDDLWHWQTEFFYGQETPNANEFHCVVRGSYTADNWAVLGATLQAVNVGFRPLLKPLPPSLILDGSSVGHCVHLYGPQQMFFGGKLVDFDDYDMVLKDCTPLPDGCLWAHEDGGLIIVQRSSVIWMEEEKHGG